MRAGGAPAWCAGLQASININEPMTARDDSFARFREAILRFDVANAEDPNTEIEDGVPQPKELVYANRMTAALYRFAPNARETVQLAARSQHIQRWTIPRSDYPEGRAGYRRWRNDLANFHAETAARILRDVGYDEPTIARVQSLVRKDRLKADSDVQLLEDVVCHVFLTHHLADFAAKHDDDKVIDILRKTWRKMSDEGRAAVRTLELPEIVRSLLEKIAESRLPTVGGSGPRPGVDLDRPRSIEAGEDEIRFGRRRS